MNGEKKREVITARLAEIEARDGTITPEAVIDDARDPESPLHAQFNWDVEKAAREHWLDVARSLIKRYHVKITVHKHSVEVPRYVRDPRVPKDEQGYVATVRVKDDRELALDVLKDEAARIDRLLRRFLNLAEGFAVEHEAEEMLQRFGVILDRLKIAA